MKARELTEVEKALRNVLYMVRVFRDKTERVYVELNDDRGVRDDPQEALVRVFFNLHDAARYSEVVAEYQMLEPEHVRVAAYDSLEAVFELLGDLDEKAIHVFGCPIRIELSKMAEGEHPQNVETLFTAFAERH